MFQISKYQELKRVCYIFILDGNLKQRAETISKLDGILSVSIHVGNSDILAEFVYDNSECLVDIISEIKHMQDIEKVLWSEEIYTVPTSKENILKSFKKYWTVNNKNNNHGPIRDFNKQKEFYNNYNLP